MTRVVFVDDDPMVLAGLRRMLRASTRELTMEFASSAAEALQLLEASSFDVIVSDIRMPGMSGTQLLAEVKKRYPQMVRIVLSGYCEEEGILQSIGPAHQYLSKPCDPEMLTTTIRRACALNDRTNNTIVQKLVTQIDSLPSLPGVYSKLLRELKAKDASINKVGEVIAQDIGMTTKLLQLLNSSFFGLPQRVEDPTHAACLIGLDLLRPLVLSAGVFSQFDKVRLPGFSLDAVVQHSLVVSKLAQQVARDYRSTDAQMIDDALLGGLIHDVGKMILACQIPEKYKETLRLAKQEQIPLQSAELETLGVTHCDVGSYLLDLWGLPNPIVESAAFHHEPWNCPAATFSAMTAVYIANVLENEIRPTGAFVHVDVFREDYLNSLGVLERLPRWRLLAEQDMVTSS